MSSSRSILLVVAGTAILAACTSIWFNMLHLYGAFRESTAQRNLPISCWGCSVTNIINVSFVILLATILVISLGGILAMLLHETECMGQGHSQGHSQHQSQVLDQGKGVLSKCTCVETKQVSCEYHDMLLLRALSKQLPNVDLLYDVGLHLRLDSTVIGACLVDSKSITHAVFDMLCKWYRMQDGLGINSDSLKELKQVLRKNNLGSYVKTVIQKHFDER